MKLFHLHKLRSLKDLSESCVYFESSKVLIGEIVKQLPNETILQESFPDTFDVKAESLVSLKGKGKSKSTKKLKS